MAIARDLLAAAVVVPLDQVLCDVPPAPAKRYGRCQSYRTKDDQECWGGKLHCYAQFCQGGEDRIDDDRVPGYVRQDVAVCSSPHDPREKVGKQSRQDEDQDRRYYARYVSYELCQDLRYLLDAQGIGGHCDGDDEHAPENELTKDRCRGLAGLSSVEKLLYATSFHPAVEAYGLKDPCDDCLKDLGHDVANDQYDDGADQLRDEGEECIKTSSQRLDHLLTLPFG